VLLLSGDLLLLSLALVLALALRSAAVLGSPYWLFGGLQLHWWLVLWAIWTPVAITVGIYDLRIACDTTRCTLLAAGTAGAVSLVYLVLPIWSAPLTRSRLAWFAFACAAVIGIGIWRIVYSRFFHQPAFTRRTVIVGAGNAGRALAETISHEGPASGIELIGFVDDDPALSGKVVDDRPVLASGDELRALVTRERIDEVVVAITDSQRMRPKLIEVLVDCWEQGTPVIPMALYLEEMTGAIPVEHIGQNLFALVPRQPVLQQRLWGAVRRGMDLAVGVSGLLALGLVLPTIALAIYVDCPGPIFYRQQRVGKRGKVYWITKFRSMIPDAERNGAAWAKKNDSRITRVGRIMRKTRLDELPQLWNLVVGDMSLIGPRPERPEFVSQLEEQFPYYAVRHSVKPGITGWAQVRYRYGNTTEDALIKLQYDLYYVKHWGPLLDISIILNTIRVVLSMQGN